MSLYKEWGFSSNPFEPTALPANEIGNALLVGRDKEISLLSKRIYNYPQHTTVEGVNGVGKTSLINVTLYRAFLQFLEDPSGQLLYPCIEKFQLTSKDINEFEIKVYRALAQTLINAKKEIESVPWPDTSAVEKWLNSPQLDSYQANIMSLGGGITSETNTSEGFEKSGFIDIVRNWLSQVFPEPKYGGIVCIVDNLELLQTSREARAMLEEIRDTVLAIPGTRWVLCGASGIVRSSASSPRLDGYLHAPVEVSGFDEALAIDVYKSRYSTFAESNEPYLPLTSQDFEILYDILNNNIRSTLSYVGRYCLWASDGDLPVNDEDKRHRFQEWLAIETYSVYDSVKRQIRPRAWRLFEEILDDDGNDFSPGDYEKFGFNNAEALRPHVKDLEENGILSSSQDETDQRRKLIQVTPKGWAVAYAIANPR